MKKDIHWLIAILLCISALLTSCSREDNRSQNPQDETYKGVLRIILDTDIGSSTDDLFALEMLYRYEQEGRCQLLGVVVDRAGEDYSAFGRVTSIWSFRRWRWDRASNIRPSRLSATSRGLIIHPIKQVYMTCNCNTGQKMWDPLAVIHAVGGDEQFMLSERGTVSLTSECATIFTPSATGNCRYQLPGSAEWNAAMLEKIRKYNTMR